MCNGDIAHAQCVCNGRDLRGSLFLWNFAPLHSPGRKQFTFNAIYCIYICVSIFICVCVCIFICICFIIFICICSTAVTTLKCAQILYSNVESSYCRTASDEILCFATSYVSHFHAPSIVHSECIRIKLKSIFCNIAV